MEPIRFLWNTLKSHASYVFFFFFFWRSRMTIPDSIAAAVCILCCTRKQQFHFIQSRKTEKKVNNLIPSNVTNGRKFR
ncbi:hypothetical protein POTOM_025604 [Populus tomentosa]|uniref:Uncharacterized protein n=1 Tax=Populus tomentosa TaxID=118781 RepID=A0A8X7ZLH5_POPTO|nr:hypothetical protein POTOM_025604 [Populus tomentosa]